jgi:hypothetical protein
MITEVSPLTSVVLNASGNGQCGFGPPSGTKWALRLSSGETSTSALQPQLAWYRGSPTGPLELLDQTFTGAQASTGKVAGTLFYPGQWLWAVWTGGDVGARATLRAFGQQGARSDPLLPAPLGEGATNSTAIIVGNELIIVDPTTHSEVHIFLTSLGATVQVRPADTPAGTLTPAVIVGQLNGSNRPYLSLRSPQLNGAGYSEIQLYADELGNEIVTVTAPAGIQLHGPVTLEANSDLAVVNNTINIDTAGFLDMVNARPSGNVTTTHGRGITGEDYYTGGTGPTSAGATEAALAAWTGADDFRFKAFHLYSLHASGGVFSSVAAATELASIKIRSAVNSTAAQFLGEARRPCVAGVSVSEFDFTRYIQVGAADVDKTSLGLTVARVSGTGNHSLFGNTANFPLQVRVKDEGYAADSQFANVAITIT